MAVQAKGDSHDSHVCERVRRMVFLATQTIGDSLGLCLD